MRALEVKDEFVASVSHELRTPLTSILGHLELLADRGDMPPDATEQVLIVERNALRLAHLVSDLLHVAQVRYGGVQIARTHVDLAVLVRDALEAVRPIAGASDIDLLL
ncbi:MAG: PAS domain-containing sensor histidine kinase, partial [Rhodocyclaceae bacterium]|nr:PAS domain-containing sensor histidine kinase [Rhodocyclaceae bacterium]